MNSNLKRNIRIFKIFLILFLPNLFLLKGADLYLKRQVYLMDEEDRVFKRVTKIALSGNELFIVENIKSQLFKYQLKNKSLKYVKTIARRGVGPGDLNLPIHIFIDSDMVIVKDEIGISYFKKDGSFISKFRAFTPISSFASVNNRIYILHSNPDISNLINIYDNKGKMIGGIGNKFLNIDYSKSKTENKFRVDKFFYEGKVLSDEKYIYYFNAKFGHAMIFDLKGEKILEKNILPFFGKAGNVILKKNKELLDNGMNSKDGSYFLYNLFIDMAIHRDKIYLIGIYAHNDHEDFNFFKNNYVLMGINKKTLELEEKYIIHIEKNESINSFTVGDRNGNPVFLTFMTFETDDGFVEFKK